MPINNRMLVGRNMGNHKVLLKQGQIRELVGGAVIATLPINKVNKRVNLTNGIAGMSTNAPLSYKPKVKESPVYSMQNNKSILDDFKGLSFNSKKKKNIKLRL